MPKQAHPDATPHEFIELLKAGNRRFADGTPRHQNTDAERLELAGREDQGEHACATVISCSDSRVPVERIFDAGVMDLFVVRVAGNILTPGAFGSVEYGMAHVLTPVLLVLGHTQCGAVTATTGAVMNGTCLPPEEHRIAAIMDKIRPAVERAAARHPDADAAALVPVAIEENVWLIIEELFRESPVVRNIVAAGKAVVVGAIYDLATGEVHWLPTDRVDRILADTAA